MNDGECDLVCNIYACKYDDGDCEEYNEEEVVVIKFDDDSEEDDIGSFSKATTIAIAVGAVVGLILIGLVLAAICWKCKKRTE